MIPPEHNSSFVAHMERVLDVYKRPFDPLRPVVCMDESPKQLIAETRVPIPGLPGRVARHDYEYRRCGVCTVFLASEPLAGKRMVRITERRTKRDWAHFLEEIADQYESAEKITLVMDNLNTHVPGSLYEAFAPDKAKALWDRFDFVYTPKHGSWLNVAENRVERAQHAVSGQENRRHQRGPTRGRSVAVLPRQQERTRQLAVHHTRRTDQARSALSDIR